MSEQKPTVLLIDDSPTIRELMLSTIEDAFPQATCLTATDVASGLTALANNPVHVVVTDMGMHGANGVYAKDAGLEIVRHMLEAHPDTPCVVVSGGFTDSANELCAQRAIPRIIKGSAAFSQDVVHAVRTALASFPRTAAPAAGKPSGM